jgi:hypothetical protein
MRSRTMSRPGNVRAARPDRRFSHLCHAIFTCIQNRCSALEFPVIP